MKHFFGTVETQPLWKKFEKENGTVSLTEYRDFVKMLRAAVAMAEKTGCDVPRET